MPEPDPATLLRFAKRMRREPSATERLLWGLLRDRRLEGVKFRRQVPIGRYIADVVCFQHRLVIEADGWTHEDSATDPERDAWFSAQGFRVLRFKNDDIHNLREDVFAAILAAVGEGGVGDRCAHRTPLP